MDAKKNDQLEAEQARQRILTLLQEMPPENLAFIEQFVLFMRQQGQPAVAVSEQEGQVPYLHPTVPVPASTLSKLTGIMPPVGGDALADTEALYDNA